MDELDMLAALDMVDVDFKTGQCKKGPKVVALDKLARSCSTREDGILHGGCADNPQLSCKPRPLRAEAIVADIGSRSVPTAFAVP